MNTDRNAGSYKWAAGYGMIYTCNGCGIPNNRERHKEETVLW